MAFSPKSLLYWGLFLSLLALLFASYSVINSHKEQSTDDTIYRDAPIDVSLQLERKGDELVVWAINDSSLPVTSKLILSEHERYSSVDQVESAFSLRPYDRTVVARFTVEGDISFAEELLPWINQITGMLSVAPLILDLPCACNKKCVVSQTFGITHKDWAKYAVDFDMPIGSPVFSMSDGIVVDVFEKGHITCSSPSIECESHLNFIKILDPHDGMIEYLHLAENGALVEIGDSVVAGQRIAISGNTGFSTGPHLHVARIRVTEKLEQETVPLKFRVGRDEMHLEVNHFYKRVCSS